MSSKTKDFLRALERTAELSCKLEPVPGENTVNCQTSLHGGVDALLNAYVHLSVELFKKIAEHEGEEDMIGLHAVVNMEIIKGLGIDMEAEIARLVEEEEAE